MRPSCEQLLERQPGDLAAHAVEAREDDRAGRVVDDEVDPGELLQGADVASLAADDPALHVVGRSCTTETVVSAAWPAASRCMTTERMLRARRSASRRPPPRPAGRAARCRGAARPRARAGGSASPARRSGRRPAPARARGRASRRELLAPVLHVALAVLERALALAELAEPGARAPPRGRAAAPRAARSRRAAPRSSSSSSSRRAGLIGTAPGSLRSGAASAPPPAASARGRWTRSTTATATAAATSAVTAISIFLRLLDPARGRRPRSQLSSGCGSAPRDGGSGSRLPDGL